MLLTDTLLAAVALAVVNLWLSMRAGVTRTKAKVSIGDGDNELLRTRMRAHANFNEYVPIALVLMALIELKAGHSTLLLSLGLLLIVGRVLHPFGMERPVPNFFRAGGILITYLVMLALIVWGGMLLYAPAGPTPIYVG